MTLRESFLEMKYLKCKIRVVALYSVYGILKIAELEFSIRRNKKSDLVNAKDTCYDHGTHYDVIRCIADPVKVTGGIRFALKAVYEKLLNLELSGTVDLGDRRDTLTAHADDTGTFDDAHRGTRINVEILSWP